MRTVTVYQPPVPTGGKFLSSNPKDTAMLKAYSRAVARINSLRTDEEGATATEYALIIGVASIAIVGALALIAPAVTTLNVIELDTMAEARSSASDTASVSRWWIA